MKKVERIRPETKRSAIQSEKTWWADKHYLDAEMRRRLEIGDKSRSKPNSGTR